MNIEQQEEWQYLTILQKMDLARQDGYFTKNDVEDIQIALGLSFRSDDEQVGQH